MQINYQGRQIEATEMEVVTSQEPWREYRLTDGKVLCIKDVLVSVFKSVTETGSDGQPIYVTASQAIIKVRERGTQGAIFPGNAGRLIQLIIDISVGMC